MGPAALLTPSKSSALTQLLSRQHFVRVSPLAATLMDFPASVANKRLAAGLNPLNATLTKNRGVGGVMVNQPSPLQRSNAQRFNVPALCGAPCYTVPPMARQRLGQHFLSDLHWREEIARAIRVSPHSTVPLPQDDKHCWIEIGSGHGEMTEHLVAAGAPVHAIELDPSLITGLRRLANNHPNLNVIPGDILEADLAAIASGRRIRVYGNLPYFITSPILQHLFTFADLIDEIHVVIQSEVAARLAAHPGTRDYGYLTFLAAAGSYFGSRHASLPRRARKAPLRGRIPFSRFCEVVFLAKAQNSVEQPALAGQARGNS